MIMIIYIHDGALYFLLCLSYAFYSYFATFAIFVPKMREEDLWNTCKVNQIPKVEIWEIYEISLDLKKKMEIFIF